MFPGRHLDPRYEYLFPQATGIQMREPENPVTRWEHNSTVLAYLSGCKINPIPALDALQAILNVTKEFRMNLLQNKSTQRTHQIDEIRTKFSGTATLALPTFSKTPLWTPVSGT